MGRWFGSGAKRWTPSVSLLAMESELAVIALDVGYIDENGRPTGLMHDGSKSRASAAQRQRYVVLHNAIEAQKARERREAGL